MLSINLILPSGATRKWHSLLFERLQSEGHDVCITTEEDGATEVTLDFILQLERRLLGLSGAGLASRVPALESGAKNRASDLVIDLTRKANRPERSAPTLVVHFQNDAKLLTAAHILCRGSVPVIDVLLDGKPVGHAEPMANSRVIISRGLSDVLARAITLVTSYVNKCGHAGTHQAKLSSCVPSEERPSSSLKLLRSYLTVAIPRLVLRGILRLRYLCDHWYVGYRFIDGPGVAETGSLAGESWQILPDSRDRFYADPFPFQWEGRYFLFVEELIYSSAKGVISVSECDGDGRFGTPRKVLEEPFHLSYPQVFFHNGEVWMIPETGSGKRLSLYRAVLFPDVWQEHCVLIEDKEIFDATLLDYDGMLWLFGTERDGFGTGSDTMVVYRADRLDGPWQAHPMNPVVIDKAASRPGGGFVKVGKRLMLPLQDGTECYGGGLGLSELNRLDREYVEFSRPLRLDTEGFWPYPRIHTLNRHRRLETIDGIARVAKPRWWRFGR